MSAVDSRRTIRGAGQRFMRAKFCMPRIALEQSARGLLYWR